MTTDLSASSTVHRIGPTSRFCVKHNPERKFSILHVPEYRELLHKWGIGDMQLHSYSVKCEDDQQFHRGMTQELLLSLFNSEALHSTLKLRRGAQLQPFPHGFLAQETQWVEVPTTATSFSLLPSLKAAGVVLGASPHRVVPMEEICGARGVVIADRLRQWLMTPHESPFQAALENISRAEFLFHVVWRLGSGGGAGCQWEDAYDILQDAARTFYRDVIVAVADSEVSEGVSILSWVAKVSRVVGADQRELVLFPTADGFDPPNCNYCYVVFSPLRSEVIVWYYAFWSMF